MCSHNIVLDAQLSFEDTCVACGCIPNGWMYVWGVCVALYLLDAHLGNGTCRRTVTMTAPLILSSGLLRYEAVLHIVGQVQRVGQVLTCNSVHSG